MGLNNINKNLHIFIKYNDDTGIPGVSTMAEHAKIALEKGEVAWGHFTKTKKSRNKKGLWVDRTKYIDIQLENNIPTFVFFYCRKSKELYAANLLNYYNREEPDTNKNLVDIIPTYYHDRIGSINEKTDIGTMRSYAFVRVTNLIKLDFYDTDFIYNFKGENEELGIQKVLDFKGMTSLLYVNLDNNFYNTLSKKKINSIENEDCKKNLLIEESAPITSLIKEDEEIYSANNSIIHTLGSKHSIENDIKNKELGYLGELLVLDLEKKRVLKELGKEYVSKIEHISEVDDERGYDILSWEKLDNGNIVAKYIEVKTTEGDKLTQFFISSGEVKFSKENKEQYYLYRVFNYNKINNSAKFFIQKGSIEENYNLIPKNYVVRLK